MFDIRHNIFVAPTSDVVPDTLEKKNKSHDRIEFQQ